MSIQLLPQELITFIAAGEVIESPVQVVKELVENSLDAQATEILIDLADSGLTHCIVQDNGLGMSPEDLVLCWQHHATSKIRTRADMSTLQSFGFRGEGLSSIAATSELFVQSRPHDSLSGWQITVEQGRANAPQPIGMPPGTRVEVRNLFSSMPGRKKALGKGKKEIRFILDMLTRCALAHPQVRWTVLHNQVQIWQKLPQTNPLEHISSLLGNEFLHHSLPFHQETPIGVLSGFLGKPQLARRTTQQQYLFINNRPVFLRSISDTIRHSFGTLLEAHMHPSFALFLTLPSTEIDVNTHPQKKTVGLFSPQEVHAEIQKLVENLLAQHDLIASLETAWTVHDSNPQQLMGKTVREATQAWQPRQNPASLEILQLNNLYLLVETASGFNIFDQHALHERILYEQFRESWEKLQKSPDHTELVDPVLLQLSPADAHTLQENLTEFSKLGFLIEPLHQQSFVVREVPNFFLDREVALLIPQVLDDLSHPSNARLHPHQHRLLSYLACRTAIKAGDPLTQEERQRLLEKTQDLSLPYTCPHGRPTMVEIPWGEVEKWFHR